MNIKTLGREFSQYYQIVGSLGTGSTCEVFEVVQNSGSGNQDDESFAAKVRPRHKNGAGSIEREIEMHRIASDHGIAPTLVEVLFMTNYVALIMKRFQQTLISWLVTRGALLWDDSKRTIMDMLRIHWQKMMDMCLLHQDIHLNNILVNTDSDNRIVQLTICDWGKAQITRRKWLYMDNLQQLVWKLNNRAIRKQPLLDEDDSDWLTDSIKKYSVGSCTKMKNKRKSSPPLPDMDNNNDKKEKHGNIFEDYSFCFTGFPKLSGERDHLESICKSEGGIIISPEEIHSSGHQSGRNGKHHVVIASDSQIKNVTACYAQIGQIPFLTAQWILDCTKRHEIVDLTAYQLSCSDDDESGRDLRDFFSGKRMELLKGNNRSEGKQWESLLKTMGCILVSALERERGTIDYLLTLDGEEDRLHELARSRGFPIISIRWIVACIFTHTVVPWDKYEVS